MVGGSGSFRKLVEACQCGRKHTPTPRANGRFVVLAPNGHNISTGDCTWPSFNLRAYFAHHILASDFVWPKVNPKPLGRVKVTSVSGGPDYSCVRTDGLVFAEGVVRDWQRWIQTCGCAKAAHLPWPKVEEALQDPHA